MWNFIIPAAASLLGGALANDSRERTAQNQMDFQREMSNTAHQREVEDLIAAGLNPMLSAKLGGASTPPGAAAQAQDVISPAVSSAMQAKLLDAQLEKLKAETDQVRSQTRITDIDAAAKEETGLPMAHAQLNEVLGRIGLNAAQVRNVDSQTANNIETLKNIPVERQRLERAAEMLYQQANLMIQQQLSESQRFEVLKAQARLYAAEAGLAKINLDAAELMGGAGAVSKEVRPYLEMILQILHGPRRGRGLVGGN